MKKIAYLFLFLFIGFLITPSIVTYIDKNIDVSTAYSAGEEEHSSGSKLTLEYLMQEPNPFAVAGLHYSSTNASLSNYLHNGERLIFLDVLSPPPK